MSNFFKELKRRKVFRVIGVYAGVSFIILQLVDIIFPILNIPEWSKTLVLVLLVIGFPIAVIFAWVFDRTQQGIVRTSQNPDVESVETYDYQIEKVMKSESDSMRLNISEPINTNSIAVLPFTSISNSEEDEVLSDGMTESILMHLAKIGSLRVVSRTSIMQYKNTTKTVREIGKELGVESILEGSIQKDGNRIRITGQLINVLTDEHRWAESYDRDYIDIFEIQSDVAQKIASALHATLTPKELKHIKEKPTTNMEAYDFYLKGMYFWNNKTSKDGNQQAIDMFDKAVGLDPKFAVAYASAAGTHIALYYNPEWDHTPDRLHLAKVALDKAIDLEPDLPEIHHAKGVYAHGGTRDYDTALIEYGNALKSMPNNSETVQYIGRVYQRLGNWSKADEYLKKAEVIAPRYYNQSITLGSFHRFMRDFKKAEFYYNQGMSIHPEEENIYRSLVLNYLHGYGNISKAREVLKQASEIITKPGIYLLEAQYYIEVYERNFTKAIQLAAECKKFNASSLLKGYSYLYANESTMAKAEFEAMAQYFETLRDKDPLDAIYHSQLAIIYAALGRTDPAIETGKKGVELMPVSKDHVEGPDRVRDLAIIHILTGEHDLALDKLDYLLSIPGYMTKWRLKLDPIYDPLRDNPRFQKLVAEG